MGQSVTYVVNVRDQNERLLNQYHLNLPQKQGPDRIRQLDALSQFMSKELARSQSSRTIKRCLITPIERAQELKIVRSDAKRVGSIWTLFKHIGYNWKTHRYE